MYLLYIQQQTNKQDKNKLKNYHKPLSVNSDL